MFDAFGQIRVATKTVHLHRTGDAGFDYMTGKRLEAWWFNIRRLAFAVFRACKKFQASCRPWSRPFGSDENLCNALSEQLVRSDNT